MKGLAIKDVAERTGIAAGTIRMWEQRYGFPEPERTAAGYRLYGEEDVEALRRVLALRERGLSVPAAVERARAARHRHRPAVDLRRARRAASSRPRSQILRKRRCSRSRARSRTRRCARRVARRVRGLPARALLPRGRAPLPRDGAHRRRRRRVRRLRRARGGATARPPRCRSSAGDALGNEWAVVVDAPGYARACSRGSSRARGARGPTTSAVRGDLDARPARRPPRRRGRGGARAPRRRRARRARRRAAGRAPAGDGASGAGADVADEPDRRLSRRG